MPARRPISARRLLLPGLLLLPWLAGCGGASPARDAAPGIRGPVADQVRSAVPPVPSADGTLRPEPGNIWAEGLETARPPAGR